MVFASYFDQYWTPFYIFINLTIYLIFLGPNTAHSLTLELDPFFCYSLYKKAAVTFYSPQFWFSFSLRITYLSFLFSNHYLCCFFFIYIICFSFLLTYWYSLILIVLKSLIVFVSLKMINFVIMSAILRVHQYLSLVI
jgi:hypothetical protein